MSKVTKDLALRISQRDADDSSTMQRRQALSRAITMMESKRPEIKQQADYLLTYLLSTRQENETKTLRVGFAGPPGAGKSSMIEALGTHLLEKDPDLKLAAV